MKVNRNREKNIYFTVRINTYIMEIYMERNYYGKLKVKVTANGCGIPLSGACIYINGKRFVVPQDNNGFSDVITLFEAKEKGIKRTFTVKAECDGFDSMICRKVPVRSGYLTFYNIPLSKVKESQKILK